MKRCVVVTVSVRDSEVDEEAGGLIVGYPDDSLRYTVVVQPQVGESQPMLMERCSVAARVLAEQVRPKPSKTTA
jgi:hypothetical protein